MNESILPAPSTANESSCAKTVVLKFGGAAVSAPERFATIADVILDRAKKFSKVAVVVSAMGDTTDELMSMAHKVNPNPPRREMDMLLSVGERISIALLAMALAAKNKAAVSFTGSQSGIITSTQHTEAKIVDVRPHRLLPHLDSSTIVIVAGFQGMSTSGEITTLGRGGSDTSAVALAIALGANRVEFFKDVDGIFDKDPNEYKNAQLIRSMTYESAIEIIDSTGHQVLQKRSVLLAKDNRIPLHILPFKNHSDPDVGTWIGDRNKIKKPGIPPIYEN